MTKTLDKTELMRLAWLTELRRQGHRQCEGDYTDSDGNVCAIGLLAEVASFDVLLAGGEAEIGELAGLTSLQSDHVVSMNDGVIPEGSHCRLHKHTFAEIADVVEGWFNGSQQEKS